MNHFKLLASGILLAGLSVGSTAMGQSWGSGPGGSWGSGPGGPGGGWGGGPGGGWHETERETYTINLRGQVFRGQRNPLQLKQLLLQQNPRLRLNGAKLESVTLLAKSRAGQGSADLTIGTRSVDRQTVYQGRGRFESNEKRSYERIDFYVPRRQDDGRWVILLDGQIKVDSVVVKLITDRPTTPPIPPMPPKPKIVEVQLGTFTIQQPIIPSTTTIAVNQDNVKSVKISGAGNMISILDVQVELKNGQRLTLPEFKVQLFAGQNLEVNLKGRDTNVRRIWVTAASLIPFGGNPGKFSVSVKAEK